MTEWWKPTKAERRWSRIHWTLTVLFLMIVASCVLSGCGFGQIGPETMISADTPCGKISYRSSKDQAAPGAVCRISPDGSAYLEMGADASSGAGTVARSVAEGIMAGIRAVPK